MFPCVSKNVTLTFCDYSVKCQPIFVIFGNIAGDKICKYIFLIMLSLRLNVTEYKKQDIFRMLSMQTVKNNATI